MKKSNLLYKVVLALLGILLLLSVIKVPYQVNMPGGTIDLSERVKVNGEIKSVKGSFNMAYVSVVQRNALLTLYALINPDWEIEKISDVKYDNETIEEANLRNKIQFEQSRNFAIKAALDVANIENEMINNKSHVVYISEDADTSLKNSDIILECEGIKISSNDDLLNIIHSKNIGDELSFKILRDDKEISANAKVNDINGDKKIGISIMNTFDIKSEFNIDIEAGTKESGPSGGMMMALMVYNSITNQDLTHGKKIVGTGTIDLDGSVGEIGGVKYKIMGAVKDDADIFLVPKENYEEAIKVKKDKGYDIEIVKVEKLEDAINYLSNLK